VKPSEENISVTIDTNKYALTESGDVTTDDIGRPVFKDQIQWDTDTAELSAILECCNKVLENRVVPHEEVDGVFELMEKVSRLESPKRQYTATLPVNYFVGMWHVVNTCRKFDLFSDDKYVSKAIDGLAVKLARLIDLYHVAKRTEGTFEASPSEILTLPSSKTPTMK